MLTFCLCATTHGQIKLTSKPAKTKGQSSLRVEVVRVDKTRTPIKGVEFYLLAMDGEIRRRPQGWSQTDAKGVYVT